MSERPQAHVVINKNGTGAFGWQVLLNDMDITTFLAYDGVRVEWGVDGIPFPTVTLKLKPHATVDLDLPDALVALLPAEVDA